MSQTSAQARILAAEEFVVGTRGAVFGTNFETVMRTLVGEYSELEKDAKAAGMSGKPLIARWVAERVVAAHHEVLAGKLSELAEKLRTLLGRQGNRYADGAWQAGLTPRSLRSLARQAVKAVASDGPGARFAALTSALAGTLTAES